MYREPISYYVGELLLAMTVMNGQAYRDYGH